MGKSHLISFLEGSDTFEFEPVSVPEIKVSIPSISTWGLGRSLILSDLLRERRTHTSHQERTGAERKTSIRGSLKYLTVRML